MKVPEPKCAVIGQKLPHAFEVVCCDYEVYLIMRFICSMFGQVGKPLFSKFPFSFILDINPLFDYDEVLAYIQDGIDQMNEGLVDDS